MNEKTSISLGYGPAGYFLIWEENGKRKSSYFLQNELWQEYIGFKMGKKFLKSQKQKIERILSDVARGRHNA